MDTQVGCSTTLTEGCEEYIGGVTEPVDPICTDPSGSSDSKPASNEVESSLSNDERTRSDIIANYLQDPRHRVKGRVEVPTGFCNGTEKKKNFFVFLILFFFFVILYITSYFTNIFLFLFCFFI